ncbi:MAG: hypothetical protein U0136_17555 [Bdellovibrionota bacterium]
MSNHRTTGDSPERFSSCDIFWPRKRTLADKLRFTYVRLVLSTPFLRRELREHLDALGVECLEEGAAYEAFGLVEECERLMRALEKIDQVLAVETKTAACFE